MQLPLVLASTKIDRREYYTPSMRKLQRGGIFMKFDILLDNRSVGIAEVTKSGLYYSIHCICHMLEKHIYRIHLNTTKKQINLGVCIPRVDRLELERKVPIKEIQLENTVFQLVKSTDHSRNRIEVIDPNVPFPDPEQIKTGKFLSENGMCFIEQSISRNIP